MNQIGASHDPIVRLPQQHEALVLATIGALSSTILLKIASVQLLELLEIVLLAYVAFRVARCNLRIELSRSMFRLAAGYGAFILLALIGCVAAFTRPFYFEAGGLNGPGVVSIARAVELVLGASATIILTETFVRSRNRCLFTAKAYFGVGTLSAVFGVAGMIVKGPLVTFARGGRASGFYNEGGPYGLYLLSVVLTGLTLLRVDNKARPALLRVCIGVNVIGLLLSASKAAYVAIALLLAIQVFYAGGVRRKVISAGIALASLIAIILFTPASKGITGYIEGGRRFEAISQVRPDDVNFSYGRVAGLFFVPRMIANHPWFGVGLGNYGLVRNAPEYRGNAAAATFLDHDGLGVPGMAAEIGLPAVFLLLYLLLQPALLSRRLTHSKSILALAFLQPVAHLCGAQLNVTYPWIASALAMGMAMMPDSESTPSLKTAGPSRELLMQPLVQSPAFTPESQQ